MRIAAFLYVPLGMLCSHPATAQAPEAFDIVILGGRVIDPETKRDEVANVAIDEGRIVRISAEPMKGRRTVQAAGLVVSPGFVDLHAHGQHDVGQRFQVLDGVTTAIDAESGAMPVAPFFAAFSGKALINFGATASHRCARMKVLTGALCTGHSAINGEAGIDSKALNLPTTPEQERQIVHALNEEIKAGALGYGLGIEYTPGAGRREIYEIFKSAATLAAPVFVHVRSRPLDTAPGVPIAVVQEVIANAAITGAPLQIAHIHSTGLHDTPVLVDMVKRARARGLDITTEAYPYTAGSTMIGSEFFRDGWQHRSNISYGDLQWPATGERLTKETFDRFRAQQPTGNVIVHMIPQDIVDQVVADPEISIASDGMAWKTSGEHPRGSGTFARVVGRYVRERNALALMTALAKMTIMPAKRLEKISPQVARKGRLQVGADADITVFDPKTILDQASFEKPMQPSIGIKYVIVNGEAVVADGKLLTGVFPGQAIKSRYVDQ